MHKLITSYGIEHTAFAIEIHPNAKEMSLNPLSMIIVRERADADARMLSSMFPEGRVVISTMARIKAVYENGKRISAYDYRNYYNNLTDEVYRNTQILCSETYAYV